MHCTTVSQLALLTLKIASIKYFLVKIHIEKPPKLDILILINTLSSKVKDPIENSLIEGNLWDSLVLLVNKYITHRTLLPSKSSPMFSSLRAKIQN